ncbi:Piso0_002345 [Millerozyma farinosa CBS 7064]|uniref:Piso0_002345 protein n=1 Tax=Pichia sorbitophila (strain ATCC MYA-4447 / BCRC 22081 / CBS 7064 / NBRC 10061 / NRRL Y-12695) TaxID=559304 RepID=G8YCD2_PICSO|nr:Piso0_002345 [Millerozyma farinosa CBS 7064]
MSSELMREKNSGITVSLSQIPDDKLVSIVSPSGRDVVVTQDADEAMALAKKANEVNFDKKIDRRLRIKADLFILPLICLIYAIQMMDKLTNSSASVMGLKKDLNMSGDMYSWTGSGFYLGYLVFEFPSSYLLQRFPLSKCGFVFLFLWGTVLCLCSTPNYIGFEFLRVALGMLESSMTPMLVIITSQWYKKEEQFFRSAIWFSCCGFGSLLGSAIAVGCYDHLKTYTIAGWKVLLIITGLITVLLSFAFLFWIPDSPASAWFLSDEERLQMVQRIRGNQQGFGNKTFKRNQFIEAWTDYRTYLYFFFSVAMCIPNGGLTTFGSILLNSVLGYGVRQTLVYGCYQGLIEFAGCILIASCIRFVKHRMAICMFGCIMNIIFVCLFTFSTDPYARLGGYLCLGTSVIGIFTMISCFASNVGGYTKKMTVNALFLVGYGAGNIIGPQTFLPSQAPQYVGGQIAMVVSYCVSFVLAIALYASYYFENKKRDRLQSEGKFADSEHLQDIEFADLTDKENPLFRYSM